MLRKLRQPACYLALIAAASACGPALQYRTGARATVAEEQDIAKESFLRQLHERSNRVARVYDVLRVANADLCPQRLKPIAGIRIVDRAMFANAEQRELITRLYGLRGDPKVIDVDPNSPAELAGLKSGDAILNFGIGSATVNAYSLRSVSAGQVGDAFGRAGGQPVTLAIARAGVVYQVEIRPLLGCADPIRIIIQPIFNAYSDGNQILVASGVFNAIGDDDELAFLIAHELAHNLLKHIEKMKANAALGGIFGLALDIGAAAAGINTQAAGYRAGVKAGALVYSQAFEHESDYLALYMLERAGFDASKAVTFFRRRSADNPQGVMSDYLSTHPSNPERAAAMHEALDELAGKKARGEAILPTALPGEAIVIQPVFQQAMRPAPVQPQVSPPNATIAAAVKQPSAAVAPAPATTPPARNMPVGTPATTLLDPSPLAPLTAGVRSSLQLYLIRGQIVSNPPQSFSGQFFDNGQATVILGGPRRVSGSYELFELSDSIKAKYTARLIVPDSTRPFIGADAKGFAAFSDVGLQLECSFAVIRATGRGEGTCGDNGGNTYRLALE